MLSVEADEATRIVAVLHDVVEDADFSLDDILVRFGEHVRAGVDAVTRRAGEDYFDFARRAGMDQIGRKVKIADLRDNLRGDATDEASMRRREKYLEALAILQPT
jgi:(p)ppGpp synthase/HD superfamily hydrolase